MNFRDFMEPIEEMQCECFSDSLRMDHCFTTHQNPSIRAKQMEVDIVRNPNIWNSRVVGFTILLVYGALDLSSSIMDLGVCKNSTDPIRPNDDD